MCSTSQIRSVSHSLTCVYEYTFLRVSNKGKEDKYVSMEDRN